MLCNKGFMLRNKMSEAGPFFSDNVFFRASIIKQNLEQLLSEPELISGL